MSSFHSHLTKIKQTLLDRSDDIYAEYFSHLLERVENNIRIHVLRKESTFSGLKKGTMVIADLGVNIGSEIRKTRPCIVVSHKRFNYGGLICVVPLTTYKGKQISVHQLVIDSQSDPIFEKKSIISVVNIKSISKKRIQSIVGECSLETMQKIDYMLKQYFHIK